MNAAAPQEWIDANQRLMVAEFARLKSRLAGEAVPADHAAETIRGEMAMPPAIDRLVDAFGLSPFERDLMLLCAGVEMDSRLASLCATANGASSRAWASFGLALAFLEQPHWSALTPVAPLRRWRLVEIAEEAGLASARLRSDERVLHYLAGVNFLDQRLASLLRPCSPQAELADSHRETARAILATVQARVPDLPVLQLHGDDRDGQADVAAAVAAELGLQLFRLRADEIPSGADERDALATLWQRDSALLAGALLIECGDNVPALPIARLVEQLGGLIMLAARAPVTMERGTMLFEVNRPGASDQRQLWRDSLGSVVHRLNGSLDGVATQFRLSARTIRATALEAEAEIAAAARPDEVLWRACRARSRRALDDLAQRIEPTARWEDLILPEVQKATLRVIAAHVRHRFKVCDDWGFARKSGRGLGLSTLFAGESGTGKTMAAEVLAAELHLDLYRVDLSSVVSKYIGETEKNLRRLFDAAEDSGAVLLFDEADALFGKRSEVKDSHDRYANIEVSYLLQRMEAYTGLAILTTNLKTALDVAFQRRLRFVVQFPFPDAAQREAIWRSVFPGATPTAALDFVRLAQLQMAGGHIRNIALNAAFLAAESGEPVRMVHLLQAAHGEAGKRERPLNEAETRGWV